MMETEEVVIEGVTYTFRKGNFKESREVGTSLGVLLKGALLVGVDSKEGNMDFKANFDVFSVLSHLDHPAMKKAEQFILKYMTATVDGKTTKLDSDNLIESHFNTRRSHYFDLIVRGAKFHFLDFLPAGLRFLKSIDLQAMASTFTSTPKQTG